MTVISNPLLLKKKAVAGGGGSDYNIERSLRFNNADTTHLARTPATKGDTRAWTISVWVKRSMPDGADKFVMAGDTSDETGLRFDQDNLHLYRYDHPSYAWRIESSAVFRDPAAWYHIVGVYDSSNAVQADRLRLYVNGVRLAVAGNASYPAQNVESTFNTSIEHNLGRLSNLGNTENFDGLMAEPMFISGLALTPAAFGSFDSLGVWNPKAFALPAPNANTTWSSSLTTEGGSFESGYPATKLFDGSLNTVTASDLGSHWIKFTPSGGISYSQSVRIYQKNPDGSDTNNTTFTLTDTDGTVRETKVADNAGLWTTLHEGKGTFTELKAEADDSSNDPSTNWNYWAAIEVDGVLLIDGITDPTTRVNPNNGRVWSTASNWDNTGITGDLENLFDINSVTNYIYGQEIIWDTSGYSDFSGILEFHMDAGSGCTIEVNDNAITPKQGAVTSATGWWNFGYFSDINKIKVTKSGGTNPYFYGVRLNGHVLYNSTPDNSFHLKFNDISTNEALGKTSIQNGTIASANGASPILNTSDDYGQTVSSGNRTDPNSGNLELALPFNNSTSDVSSNSIGMTNSGSTNTTSNTKFYGNARDFDGSNDSIYNTSASSDLDWNNNSSVCYEWWARSDDASQTGMFLVLGETAVQSHYQGFVIKMISGVFESFISGNNSSWNVLNSTPLSGSAAPAGEWHHYAWCYDASIDKVLTFYDGKLVELVADVSSGPSVTEATLNIGGGSEGNNASASYFNGQISDFRFYKGTPKYTTAGFVVPKPNDFTVNNINSDANPDIYSEQNFNVAQWTGTGSGLTVTGVGFEPDIVWTKCKSHDVDHKLFSRILGTTKLYEVNQDRGIFTDANSLTAFNSDGFVLGTSGDVNTNTRTYSAWCFKCGGAASSNTKGSITSSVSANAQGLYSVLSYTGTGSNATVGHGLGKKPAFIWVKEMNDVSSGSTASGDAKVYMSAHGAAGAATMHNDTAFADASGYWQSEDPTTDVFSIGDDGHVNTSGKTYQAICFGDVPGKIKVGSYTGNENATGPVVELGFKPLFIVIKGKSASRSWIMHDTINDTGANPVSNQFLADTSTQMEDNQYNQLDFNANGFQVKGAGDYVNKGNETFYYLAISADTPEDNDSFTDSPSNYDAGTEGKAGEVRGNFCTLNPLTQANNSGTQTFKQGNLYHESTSSAGAWHMFRGTMAIPKGSTDKFYYEVEWVQDTANTDFQVGWVDPFQKGVTASGFGDSPHEYCFRGDNGKKFNNNAQANYGNAPSQGDVVGVGYDNKAIRFWVNGVEQDSGTAAWTGVEKHLMPGFATYTQSGDTFKANFNFGQRPFKHPQSGYKALCTQNLPDIFSGDESTIINNPSKYFDVKLFTGDDTTDGSKKIKYNFSPDLYWQKSRSNAYHNRVFDRIRGQGSLVTNENFTPNTDANSTLTTFDSDGVSIENTGDEVGNADDVTYVGWAWDAGTTEIAYAKYLTGGIDSNFPARNAFDGLLTSGGGVGCRTTQGGTMTFEPPTDIAFTKLEIYANNDNSNGNVNNNTWKVNDTDVTSAINSGAQTSYAWIDVTSSVSSPLDKIEIKSNSSGGTNPRIQAIRINDVILTANGDGVDGITEVRWTNTSSGFSICKYTGTGAVAKIGHGLPDPPGFVLIKALTHTSNWAVYHSSVPNTHAQKFNLTTAAFDNADYWNDSTPSNEVVHVGSNYDLNQSNAHQYIMYAWSPVPGYSSFGSFTGNGSADGTFVYTGFKPRWILTKNTETTRQWVIWDTRRSPFNFADECLFTDVANAESTKGPDSGTDNDIDILSNGFKIRNVDSAQNEDTKKILYAAFAEHPFKLARAR